MKRLRTKLTSLSIILLVISNYTFAQVSCTEKLGKAHSAFEKGQIDEVPDIIGNCLQSGFTKDEKVSAYRLLTLCDLYYNRSENAIENMQNMLIANSEYKLQDIDPSEFRKLYGDFRTVPVFIIGVKGALCFYNIYDVKNFNDINSDNVNCLYATSPSFNGGLSIESPITPRFSIVFEAYYNSTKYEFKRNILDYANISVDENTLGIDAPLLAQYNILKEGDIIPYINAGVSFNYMLNSSLKVLREDTLGNLTHEKVEETYNKMADARKNFNVGVTGGVGVRIKNVVGKGYITFDVRYSRYFRDIPDAGKRDINKEFTYGLLHSDNSFKFQNVQLFVGYKLPIYIPRLKRSVRKDYEKSNSDG
jgi:hypothetical protein